MSGIDFYLSPGISKLCFAFLVLYKKESWA